MKRNLHLLVIDPQNDFCDLPSSHLPALPDGGIVAPAHHYDYYRETAQLMDGSRSPQLDDAMSRLDSFTAGARLESSTGYRFERTEGR